MWEIEIEMEYTSEAGEGAAVKQVTGAVAATPAWLPACPRRALPLKPHCCLSPNARTRLQPRERDVHPVHRLPLDVQRQPDGEHDRLGAADGVEGVAEARAVLAEDVEAAGGRGDGGGVPGREGERRGEKAGGAGVSEWWGGGGVRVVRGRRRSMLPGCRLDKSTRWKESDSLAVEWKKPRCLAFASCPRAPLHPLQRGD